MERRIKVKERRMRTRKKQRKQRIETKGRMIFDSGTGT